MKQYYLEYRGEEYGPFDSLEMMLEALRCELIEGPVFGRETPTTASWREVDAPQEDECSE